MAVHQEPHAAASSTGSGAAACSACSRSLRRSSSSTASCTRPRVSTSEHPIHTKATTTGPNATPGHYGAAWSHQDSRTPTRGVAASTTGPPGGKQCPVPCYSMAAVPSGMHAAAELPLWPGQPPPPGPRPISIKDRDEAGSISIRSHADRCLAMHLKFYWM